MAPGTEHEEQTQPTERLAAERWPRIHQEYHAVLQATANSRAAWLFCAVLLIAAGLLVVRGQSGELLSALPTLAFLLIFTLLTIPLTIGVNQFAPIEPRGSRRRLWLQVAFILIIILFVTYRAVVFNGLGPFHILLLDPLVAWTINFLGVGNLYANWIVVPALYVALPLIGLLPLGAHWGELGLGRGYHAWRVALLWSILPLIGLAVLLALGAVSLGRIIIHFLNVFFQAGFFEEFLFRGALMTRLSALLRADWGIVLSSLAFGLFHIGTQTHQLGGDWLVGAASTIVNQAIFGLAVAIIFARTRNLLAPSIFHVILDTIGGFF